MTENRCVCLREVRLVPHRILVFSSGRRRLCHTESFCFSNGAVASATQNLYVFSQRGVLAFATQNPFVSFARV